jgi:hypothetical protein
MPHSATKPAYCRKCKAPLANETFCPRCGRKREVDAPWWAAPLVIVILILIIFSYAMVQDYKFDHLSPSQHLAEAKRLEADGELERPNVSQKLIQELQEGAFEDGLRHISAIPANSAERAEATSIAEELEIRLRELRDAKEAALQARKDKIAAVHELQIQLKNLGYDLKTSTSKVPNEIIITSKDFADTDHRVKFLSFIRNHNGPSGLLCVHGYETVRLETSLPVIGFNEQYSLDCFGSR